MRKLILTTAAVAAAICLAGCLKKALVSEIPNTFTDTRDGQTYKTVKIGTQTWMAQNLNYKTDSSWCYNDSLSYCKKYGRLYNRYTAKKACPAGYHLPSHKEWGSLVTTADTEDVTDKRLKSKRGWNKNGNATDNFGFSALPSGYRSSNGDFMPGGSFWWTATEYYSVWNIHYYLEFAYEYLDTYYESNGYSVRCVADTP
jgi:uncharacterized protein (TIGR02145 family)